MSDFVSDCVSGCVIGLWSCLVWIGRDRDRDLQLELELQFTGRGVQMMSDITFNHGI